MSVQRVMFALSATFAASVLMAEGVPEVSHVKMSQDLSRQVTVTYHLANAPAVVTFDVQTNRGDGVWVSIGGENVCGGSGPNAVPQGDVYRKIATDGDYTITWHPDLTWPDHKIRNRGARAVVTAWATDNTPDYMVVDLLPNSSERIRYYPGEAFLPGGILANDAYKTTKLVMRKILAKDVSWTMGSRDEPGRGTKNQEVQHAAKIDNNFYMAVFEITQEQWAQVYGTGPSAACTREGRRRPMESVSYYDCRESTGNIADTSHQWPRAPHDDSFLGKLRKLAEQEIDFDLPSDAQWEFACRGGIGDGYWNNGMPYLMTAGDTSKDDNMPGRYAKNQAVPDNTSVAVGPENATAIVGTYDKNRFGLYDMHGNVAEWCVDWYVHDISTLGGAVNVDKDDPTKMIGGGTSTTRVARGGGWRAFTPGDSRCASRSAAGPSTRINYIGVRVAARAGLK